MHYPILLFTTTVCANAANSCMSLPSVQLHATPPVLYRYIITDMLQICLYHSQLNTIGAKKKISGQKLQGT